MIDLKTYIYEGIFDEEDQLEDIDRNAEGLNVALKELKQNSKYFNRDSFGAIIRNLTPYNKFGRNDNGQRPRNNFNRGGGFNRPRPNGRPKPQRQKQLLVSKEQIDQIEILYKKALPLPNPDVHEIIGQAIGLEPRKVFFGINLVRQKLMLPKLPFPKRKLAVSPDQLFAIKNLYTIRNPASFQKRDFKFMYFILLSS